MNRRGRSDVVMLLGILLIFSGSMMLLVSSSKTTSAAPSADAPTVVTDPAEQERELMYTMNELAPLLYSHSIDHVARQIIHVAKDVPHAIPLVTERIINAKPPFKSSPSDKEVAELLVGLLSHGAAQQVDSMENLFAWVTSHTTLFARHPLALVIARGPYSALIPMLKEKGLLSKEMVETAYFHAVKNNDLQSIQRLVQAGAVLDAAMATTLLIELVRHNKDGAMALLLLEHGADKNAMKDNKTILMMAVGHRNKHLVQVLLEAGADPLIQSPDPLIGTALHIAEELGDVALQELLFRKISARARRLG